MRNEYCITYLNNTFYYSYIVNCFNNTAITVNVHFFSLLINIFRALIVILFFLHKSGLGERLLPTAVKNLSTHKSELGCTKPRK